MTDNEPALPPKWASIPLGEIADAQLGKMLDKARTNGNRLPYLRNINVRWGSIDTGDLLEMPFRDEELERFGIRDGDVLICEGGEPGRAAVWRGGVTELKYQKALHRVRLPSAIYPDWLVHCLYYDSARGFLAKKFTGTTIAHLTGEALRGYPVRVAPPSEQFRILDAISSYFTRVDDAVTTLDRVKRNLKRYRASVLKAAVEGRLVPTESALAKQEGRGYEPASVLLERILAERRHRWAESGRKGKYQEPLPPDTSKLPDLPEGWCWATLNSLADIQLGQQRAPVHATAETQIPYVRAANITWAGLDLTDVKSMGFPNPERYRLECGDVLLSEASGSPMEAGKPAIWKDEIVGACYQKTLLRIRPFSKALVLPAFLRAIFLRDCFTGKFARLAPGVGIVHLTAERMIEWPVPLAPVSEQRRITSEVDRLESAIDASAASVARQSVRCQGLRQSILKWAFEGKLVDQDPDDVPASVLLERINAEREASEPGTKRSQRRIGQKQVRA